MAKKEKTMTKDDIELGLKVIAFKEVAEQAEDVLSGLCAAVDNLLWSDNENSRNTLNLTLAKARAVLAKAAVRP